MSESTADFSSSTQRVKHGGSPSASCGITPVRLQPVRATVPFQLVCGNQLSPTRSVSSSSSSSSPAGSNAGPTTSRCSSPANPDGSGSDGRPFPRQTVRPPDSRTPPERSTHSTHSKVEKPQSHQVWSSGPIWWTPCLSAVTGPYLAGQWPRDPNVLYPYCVKEKSTQTPGCWSEETGEQRSTHQRSASWGSTNQLKEVRCCFLVVLMVFCSNSDIL